MVPLLSGRSSEKSTEQSATTGKTKLTSLFTRFPYKMIRLFSLYDERAADWSGIPSVLVLKPETYTVGVKQMASWEDLGCSPKVKILQSDRARHNHRRFYGSFNTSCK
jgi:hypothetical protein